MIQIDIHIHIQNLLFLVLVLHHLIDVVCGLGQLSPQQCYVYFFPFLLALQTSIPSLTHISIYTVCENKQIKVVGHPSLVLHKTKELKSRGWKRWVVWYVGFDEHGSMALWTVHKPKLISISFAKETETNNNNSNSNSNKPRSIGENHFWLSADCCFYFANDEPTTRLENLIFWLPLVETRFANRKMRFPLKFPRAVVSLVVIHFWSHVVL